MSINARESQFNHLDVVNILCRDDRFFSSSFRNTDSVRKDIARKLFTFIFARLPKLVLLQPFLGASRCHVLFGCRPGQYALKKTSIDLSHYPKLGNFRTGEWFCDCNLRATQNIVVKSGPNQDKRCKLYPLCDYNN